MKHPSRMTLPPPEVIDYRNPRHAAFRERVRAAVVQREALLRAKLVAMFVGGVLTSLLAPAIVTLIVRQVQVEWDVRHDALTDAPVVFLIASVTIIPLLYWLEHRTRGRFFEDAVREHGLGDNVNDFGMLQTSSRGEYELQTTAATWAAYLEVALFAPRLTMNAVRQWRLHRYLGAPDVPRATEVLHALLASDGGVHPRTLLRSNESMEQLWPTLLLLTLHDFTGLSKRADRVWLLSDARRALLA